MLGVPHISTGEVMRGEVAAGTELGRRVERYVAGGELVPDDLVVELVIRRLTEPVLVDRFVLDGFPRTLVQAERAYEWALERELTLFAVVHLSVGEDELVRRTAARALTDGRADDDAATFRRRLAAYRQATEP
ncbi:MAG TPA: nucleoside monophosphate kinase, partial [Acidimicrobiales bacterium]|nr:nucleoside monophosphate kinase [Acidimicrobiales bacterium]